MRKCSNLAHPQGVRDWLQGCNRKIFLRGKSHFPDFFFFRREMLFPVENSPKTKFSASFRKVKTKKVLSSFSNFYLLPFSISSIFNLSFYNFLLFFSIPPPFSIFPFFPCLFFPVGQQKFLGQKSLGGHSAPCPLPPPPVTPLTGYGPGSSSSRGEVNARGERKIGRITC